MALQANHSIVWKGNLCSDLVFTTSKCNFPSSTLDLDVFLKLKAKDKPTEVLIPCSRIVYEDRLTFYFDSKIPQQYSDTSWTEKLSLLHDEKKDYCSFGVRVHHDVLVGNFDSFKLIIFTAMPSKSILANNLPQSDSPVLQEKINCFGSKFSRQLLPTYVDVVILESNPVRVTEYKLSIQEKFTSSEYILHRKDISPDTFEWYNKNGGDMISIDVLVHLKDLNGAIVYDYPELLRIKTELVYDDGSPTPNFPLFSLKHKTNSKGKNKAIGSSSIKLFQTLRPEPVLGRGVGSQHFSFRIEEVSAHHPNKLGFKLKVSTYCETANVFHGMMEETIIVKSKPKTSLFKKRSKGGRKSILQPLSGLEKTKKMKMNDGMSSNAPRKISLDDLTESSQYDQQSNTIKMKLSSVNTIFSGCSSMNCIGCGEKLKAGMGLCPSNHKSDCRFNLTLVPFALAASEKKSSSVAAAAAKNYQSGIIEFVPDDEDDKDDDFSSDDAAASLLALSGFSFFEV